MVMDLGVEGERMVGLTESEHLDGQGMGGLDGWLLWAFGIGLMRFGREWVGEEEEGGGRGRWTEYILGRSVVLLQEPVCAKEMVWG